MEGFCVTCIKCGEAGSIKLDLTDMDTLTCSECDAEYSVDDVRAVMREWGPVLAWIDSAAKFQGLREAATA